MITLQEAKELKYGDILVDCDGKRWKVNGNTRLWKRDDSRVKVPVKHGLRTYGYITESNLEFISRQL